MMNHLPFVFVAIATLNAQQVEYPLHLNDRWEYSSFQYPGDTTRTLNQIIKDTILSNGKSYAFMEGGSLAQPFQRQSGDSVYQYLPDLHREVLYFDFSRSVGDTISWFPRSSDTTTILLLATHSVNLFGNGSFSWTISGTSSITKLPTALVSPV